jgi:hypothetical protein
LGYKENLSALIERFPKLTLPSYSWRAKEPLPEAPPVLPGKAEGFYFYGLALGIYPQLKNWLREHPERKLILLEDNPDRLASFLHLSEAKEALLDVQVHIELLTNEKIEELSIQFPFQRIEVKALTPSKKFQRLRLKLLRKTTLSHALRMDRLHGYQPFHNFIENLKRLPESFYANGLKGAFKDVPAIVCGAGPSLSIETLKTLEKKALIIAGGSTLAAMSSKGIMPHFGMAIDPNLEEYRRLKNSFAFHTPLLYSTRVFPHVFRTSAGPFGYMRSGIGGAHELWIEEELGLLDPLIGENLSPESISVTTICVAWAEFLGCNPILLNGVDLAYTNKKRYAEGVGIDEEVPFSAIDAEKSAADRIVRRKDKNGKTIHTAIRWVMESASISHFAKKHPETLFLNTGEGGLGFKAIDNLPLEEASRRYLTKEFDLRIQEKILASPMPKNTQEKIRQKIEELKTSLERVLGHLQVLAGKERGSKALAEMEIKEEIAYLILLYDAPGLFSEEKRWEGVLNLAQKYKIVLKDS